MSDPESMPPQHVPTLTEVVDWPQGSAAALASNAASEVASEVASPAESPTASMPAVLTTAAATPAEPPAILPNEEQLVQRVLVGVQRQVDLMLEYRLREMLTPLLARATDSVVRDARSELASTLRDVVARAVAQELARHRIR